MESDLTQGSIKQHIKNLAIPASVGYFFHTMFNVTDTYFAGQISTEALSALTLSFSIFFMVIAVAGGMANAVTALVGNALGEKNREKASNIAMNSLVFGSVLAIFLTITALWLTPYLFRYLGASGEYLETTLDYIEVIIFGSISFVFAFFLNGILRALGDTKSFRNALIASAFANVILDFWFINGGLGIEPQGVRGIAIATVIVETSIFVYLLYQIQKKNFLQFSRFKLNSLYIKELISQGFPQSVNMILMAFGIYIITYFASPYGQEVVAAFGIGMRVEQIVLLPAIGLNIAVLSIVSQNSGAKQFARVEETVKQAFRYGSVVAITGTVLLFFGNEFMVKLFSDDAKVIEEGIKYLYVEVLVIFPFMVLFIQLALLTGIKKPTFILYISVFRQVIAPILLLSLFSFLGLGVLSVWLGIAGIVIVSTYIAWWYSWKKFYEISQKETS